MIDDALTAFEFTLRRRGAAPATVAVLAGPRADLAQAAIDALVGAGHDSSAHCAFDLIAVGNAAMPPLRQLIPAVACSGQNVTCLDNVTDQGFAFAANQALIANASPVLVLVTADVTLPHAWFDRLLAALSGDRRAGIVELGDPACSGLGLVVHGDVVAQIGGFDPAFSSAGVACADFLLRARLAGLPVVPAASLGVAPLRGGGQPEDPRATDDAEIFGAKWGLSPEQARESTPTARPASLSIEPDFWKLFSPLARPLAVGTSKPIRLLGVPAWGNPGWQAVLSAVLSAFSAKDPVAIVLRLEPPTPALLAHAQRCVLQLLGDLGVAVQDAPDILFEATPLEPSDRARLYVANSAYLAFPGRRAAVYRREAAACGLTLVAAEAEALRKLLGGNSAAETAPPPRASVAPAGPSAGNSRTIGSYDVTAIVSTYNSEAFMRGCMEDLVAQTLYRQGKMEILVVDSGSPQNEAAIVREFQSRFPHIEYVRSERETIYGAWNRGARGARGRYLTNANTDDRHHPEAIERLAAVLDARPEVALVYADQMITNHPHETWQQNSARERFDWPDFSLDLMLHHCTCGPQPMWRRSMHDRWGWFDDRYRVAGDWEFWLRIAQGERLVRVPEVLGLYYRNMGGLEFSSTTTRPETDDVRRRYGARVVGGAFLGVSRPESWGSFVNGAVEAQLASAPPIVRQASEMVGRGELAQAAAHLAPAMVPGASAEVVLALANVVALQGRLDQAIEVLVSGLMLHADDARLALRLAGLLALVGRLDDAESVAARARTLAPAAYAAMREQIESRRPVAPAPRPTLPFAGLRALG